MRSRPCVCLNRCCCGCCYPAGTSQELKTEVSRLQSVLANVTAGDALAAATKVASSGGFKHWQRTYRMHAYRDMRTQLHGRCHYCDAGGCFDWHTATGAQQILLHEHVLTVLLAGLHNCDANNRHRWQDACSAAGVARTAKGGTHARG